MLDPLRSQVQPQPARNDATRNSTGEGRRGLLKLYNILNYPDVPSPRTLTPGSTPEPLTAAVSSFNGASHPGLPISPPISLSSPVAFPSRATVDPRSFTDDTYRTMSQSPRGPSCSYGGEALDASYADSRLGGQQRSPSFVLPQASSPVQHLHRSPPFDTGAPAITPFQGGGAIDDGGRLLWSGGLTRQGLEGAYMTLPGSDTPIPVQMDYSRGSKKADEKRQRNAVASTRHRRKKKTEQEENNRELRALREEKKVMQRIIAFYRNHRNRLRDIVAKTPAIQEHAACPPSPTLTQHSLESSATACPQARNIPQGYMSENSSSQRPSKRRKIDDHLVVAPQEHQESCPLV